MFNTSQVSNQIDRAVDMTPDVTDFDLLLLDAHNRIRADPHSYVPILEEMILSFTSEEVPNLFTDPVTGQE